jgi:hypothetical protein
VWLRGVVVCVEGFTCCDILGSSSVQFERSAVPTTLRIRLFSLLSQRESSTAKGVSVVCVQCVGAAQSRNKISHLRLRQSRTATTVCDCVRFVRLVSLLPLLIEEGSLAVYPTLGILPTSEPCTFDPPFALITLVAPPSAIFSYTTTLFSAPP